MTKPIAQTFYINEPIGGVEGVVLTRLDVYFESVSSTYGVELQIRATDNGNPTSSILPRASKVIQVSDTYASNVTFLDSSGATKTIAAGTQIIQASVDASFPVVFEFDTPISLQSQTSYAFVIIPVGGNPDYRVWTSELAPKAGNDVTTGTPVHTNNDTGTLFLSSNDIQFTSIPGEDIKFTAYIANFTSQSGTAAYITYPEEGIYYTDLIGSFQPSETILLGNNSLMLSSLVINANTGTFTVGETVYQSNGSANNATGILFSANTTKVLIKNTNGTFVTSNSTSYKVTGVTSAATANVTTANQSVISSSNTTLIVPFTGNSSSNIFYANQSLYIGMSDQSKVVCKVVDAVINSTAVSLKYATPFTDSSCILGQIRGDNLGLYARYSGPQGGDPVSRFGQSNYWASLYFSSSNSTVNFANATGQLLIGFSSGSSATNLGVLDFPYNAVIPDFTQVTSRSTNIDWTYYGIDTANTYDSTGISITNGVEKQLLDKPRMLLSRTAEVTKNSGNSSLTLFANLTSSNTKFSPLIDGMMNNVRMIRNFVAGANQTSGYFISTSNTNGSFNVGIIKGDIVSQSNGSVIVTGQVLIANPTGLYIANTSGAFTNGYSIYVSNNAAVNTMARKVVEYNEKYSANVFPYLPRYISKNVVLAENQDAEDLKLYLTAYRPANTNFQVYGKFLHNQDPDAFSTKIWSRLSENTVSKALISSGSNEDDFVEIMYELPTSLLLTQNNVTCNTTSANITIGSLGSTAGISNGNVIYLYNSSSNNFITRQVSYVANNSTLVLTAIPSFASTNSDLGIITGLEHPSAAFLHANNNGICRYVSNTDVVFDTYKNFAVKIVPTSETTAVVPRAGDYRALALQV